MSYDSEYSTLLDLFIQLVESQAGIKIEPGEEWLNDAETLATKLFHHLVSMQTVAVGATVESDGVPKIFFVDHASVKVIARAALETYLVFFYLYGNSDRSIFDGLLKSVPATYNCYVEFFREHKEGDPTTLCPPVEVPHFQQSYEADGLETSLGVPRCVRKGAGYSFSPKRAYELENCREQVEVFTGKRMQTYHFDAASAQKQYDTYLQNLKRVLDQKADDAIRKFNCMARGERFCM